ncbi:AAA family ATPase [Paenibacillus sp. FSL R7-0273]|uniref:AAA family ATPase n=1 Tax=Paenibacillus sp. FSL R7-0273 TaxID=1536772 RepID=UPI000AC4E974|nr:AAA family ATPase [Paenibacillus sp. FSL R7-0273]
MLRIKALEIQNINSISNLSLKFSDGLNILCGTNGVGKTTILECIAGVIRGKMNVRTSVTCSNGKIGIIVKQDEDYFEEKVSIDAEQIILEKEALSTELIFYNTSHRSSSRHVSRDYDVDRPPMSPLDAVKRWLYRNYIESNEISSIKQSNFELVRECINKIDNNVYFEDLLLSYRNREMGPKKTIHTYRTVEFLIKTPHGTMDINYLSSGYKACFTILIDLIRQLELTMNEAVEEYQGIVLIDEIDLHLHPEWQTRITSIIKWLVPKAQIIVTTHSPHVIQSANAGEIIPLGIDETNNIYVRNLPKSYMYGYQGWNVEEILVHVMGLEDPMSKVFREKLEKFEIGLSEENKDKVIEAYNALNAMLHNRNPLLALIKIQASEYLEEDEE